MKTPFFALLLSVAALFQACVGARGYASPDAIQLAMNHRTVAVLPSKVTIAAQRKVDPAAIAQQQASEALNFQSAMHAWLLRRKGQGRFQPELLDVGTTNAKLTQAGYFNGTALTPAEICNLLGVDAVINSNFMMSKPVSEGAAIAIWAVTGVATPTNSVTANFDLYDASGKKTIWNFNRNVQGSTFSDAQSLVDYLMRRASKKMPYAKMK